MNTPKLAKAMNYIDDDLVSGAVEYKRTKKKNSWMKWGAMVACLCLVITGLLGGSHVHFKEYAKDNNIQVISGYIPGDAISSADVTPEQAEKLSVANEMHNAFAAKNFDWYGNCYYNFENDVIMIGLTENTADNQAAILSLTDNDSVQFFECDYSYKYLEELYNKLDDKRTVLSMLGVDRFNISIEKNRVNVRIDNAEKYEAIYMANELDSIGGAIVFTSDTVTADSN